MHKHIHGLNEPKLSVILRSCVPSGLSERLTTASCNGPSSSSSSLPEHRSCALSARGDGKVQRKEGAGMMGEDGNKEQSIAHTSNVSTYSLPISCSAVIRQQFTEGAPASLVVSTNEQWGLMRETDSYATHQDCMASIISPERKMLVSTLLVQKGRVIVNLSCSSTFSLF